MGNYQAFDFNQDSAKKADGGGRIETTGKYVGKITRAEFITSTNGKGTQGIEFDFMSDDKSYTTFTLWTHQADGTPIFGYDKVNSILACTKTRTLTPTPTKLEKYSYDAGGKIMQECVIAPELTDKPIGLLLQRENYRNDKGEWRHQMNFYAAFEVGTEFMAKEICEKKTKPEELEKTLNRLVNAGDATRKQSNQPQKNTYQQTQAGSYANAGKSQAQQNNEPDDDLPFQKYMRAKALSLEIKK